MVKVAAIVKLEVGYPGNAAPAVPLSASMAQGDFASVSFAHLSSRTRGPPDVCLEVVMLALAGYWRTCKDHFIRCGW